MRHAIRRTALLLTFGLASGSVGLTTGPASAAEPGCPDTTQSCVVVTVVSTKDFKKTFKKYNYSAAQLSTLADLTAPAFTTRTKADGKILNEPRPKKAISLRALLNAISTQHPEQAKLLDKVTFSEAQDPTGVPRVLDKPAFGDPIPANKDFPYDDDLQPAIYFSAGNPVYFRPLTGEDDVNRPDRFRADGRLDITIHTTGKLLAPTATISNSAPSTKDKPTFSVALSEKPGTRLNYLWDYGDGRTADRAKKSPSHRYPQKGTYGAFVTVRGADGSYGRSDVVEVKVAKPPKAPATSGSGGVTGGGGSYVPPYTPPTTSLPEPEAVQEPPVEEPTPDVPVDDGLVDVEGYVLAGSEIVPGGTPETIPGTQASSAPTPASKTSVRKQVATWTVAALAIALLVGAGATSETRWFRNRLRHLRRRA